MNARAGGSAGRAANGLVFERKSKYTDERIADTQRQAESGVPLAEIIRKPGITGRDFPTFRLAFGTRALRRGIPREVLAKMMGQSTALITDRSMHVADDQYRAAARAMSAAQRLAGSDHALGGRGKIAVAGGARDGARETETEAAVTQVFE